MAYRITEECVACGSCDDTCPVGAAVASGARYRIDAETCIECGACETACPNGAVVSD